MSDNEKRITVADVAKVAGVSIGSVSRVLTGKNWVSPHMRAVVERAVQQLNYVPNSLAQSLKSQRSMTIGALVSDVANPLHGIFLSAAEEIFQEAGYMLLVASSHSNIEKEKELLRMFSRGRVDGLLLAHTDETDCEIKRELASYPIPIVFHDRESGGYGDAVKTDHFQGAYIATKYLISLGHRRILLLTPWEKIYPGRARIAGFEKAILDSGTNALSPIIRPLNAYDHRSLEEVSHLMNSSSPPTAIICLGTSMLAGVLTALKSGGWLIPKNVSIIGVGDTDLMRLATPAITTVRWDIAESGRNAAKLMLKKINSEAYENSMGNMMQVPELVIRDSCAAPSYSISLPNTLGD